MQWPRCEWCNVAMVFRRQLKSPPRRRYVCRVCGSWVSLLASGQVYSRFSLDRL